jgi:hypothetical protein
VVGIREHEHYLNRAVDINVDSIQAANVPKVANNDGFALMLSELVHSNGRSAQQLQKQYETARTSGDHLQPPTRAASPAANAAAQPPPSQPADLGAHDPLSRADNPTAGEQVIVSNAAWPTWKCTEWAGAGWSATIKRVTASTCLVRFDEARTRDGRPYADVLVPRAFIMRAPRSTTSTAIGAPAAKRRRR